jgi:hypothetical protein
MAHSKRDEAPNSVQPQTPFRLVVYLDDGRHRRAVSLDYDDRTTIERQIAGLHRDTGDAFQLFEFRNECGETLAVLARALVRYEILMRSSPG